MSKTNLQKLPIKKEKLLKQALTHRSWLNENSSLKTQSNERLEFLGDAVLELVVTEYLYTTLPNEQEGKLTALRAALVRTETLAHIAKKLGIGEMIRLSKGEELTGGRTNLSLLANTFEAIIGATYLESGKEKVTKFVQKVLLPELKNIQEQNLEKDSKSSLQEIVQSQNLPAPVYKVSREEGPDHDKIFTVSVYIDGNRIATGNGKSKQLAQQQAAKHALEKKLLS